MTDGYDDLALMPSAHLMEEAQHATSHDRYGIVVVARQWFIKTEATRENRVGQALVARPDFSYETRYGNRGNIESGGQDACDLTGSKLRAGIDCGNRQTLQKGPKPDATAQLPSRLTEIGEGGRK